MAFQQQQPDDRDQRSRGLDLATSPATGVFSAGEDILQDVEELFEGKQDKQTVTMTVIGVITIVLMIVAVVTAAVYTARLNHGIGCRSGEKGAFRSGHELKTANDLMAVSWLFFWFPGLNVALSGSLGAAVDNLRRRS